MKNFQRVLLLATIICMLFISCKKDCKNHCLISGTGLILSGANEVPAINSKATGKANVLYNKCERILQFDISWNNLSAAPVAAHIHGPAPKGVNAPVVFPFSDLIPKTTSGTFQHSLKIDDFNIDEAKLKKGDYYINIHSANFPAGEIRVQIVFK